MSEEIKTSTSDVIEQELERHGTYASVTRGPSMRPLFRTGRDMVIISRPSRPLRKYDVVVYTGASNKYTMHRIIAVRDGVYIIRGDNTYRREYVRADRIIGILTEYNRRGKHGTTDSVSYKLYSRIWHYLYPVRFICYKIKCVLSRIKHTLLRKKTKTEE